MKLLESLKIPSPVRMVENVIRREEKTFPGKNGASKSFKDGGGQFFSNYRLFDVYLFPGNGDDSSFLLHLVSARRTQIT